MVGEKNIIICRCNDIALEDLKKTIEEGVDDFELLRKYLRIGFGPCQGRSCIMIAARWLTRLTGKSMNEVLKEYRVRPPIIPVPLYTLVKGDEL